MGDESIVNRDESIEVACAVDAGGESLRKAGEPGGFWIVCCVWGNNLQCIYSIYRIKNIYPLDHNVKWDISPLSGEGPIELMGLPHG